MTDLVTDIIDAEIGFDGTEYEDYDFNFDNLVFEGGGNKGLAYVGAIMVSLFHVQFNWLLSGRRYLLNGC